jgi:uncharacterized secreted protein with C-terminal beta-propeller domain
MNFLSHTSRLIMSQKKLILIVTVVLVLVAILITGCMSTPVITPGAPGLKKFNSTPEIEQYIKESMETDQQNGYYRTIPVTAPGFSFSGGLGASQSKSQESAADGIAAPVPAIIGSGSMNRIS